MEGGIAVNGSSVALCVGHGLQPLTWCGSTKLKHIAIWETESGDLTMTEIPQDERGPQCVRRAQTLYATTPPPTRAKHFSFSIGATFSLLRLRILPSVAILIRAMIDPTLF